MASTSACVVSSVGIGSVAGAARAQAEHCALGQSVLLSSRRASVMSGVSLPSLASSSYRTDAKRSLTIVAAKATKEAEAAVDETSAAAEDFLQSLTEAWEKSDDKPAIVGLGFAGLIGLWATNGLINAIDKLPIIPDLFEIIGILFSGWFIYRYLLFKPDREELLKLIDEQKAKITGQ
ncbi:protein CURVATURE THYLAKOID 1C, chloroplastic [Physcomitrium patens]|uniref:Cyanobacterial aminoacyl-tRNA synthetase CAAD domain-containing protein n=1 Tax=Physcomitrium patens TaxID=3218 RepID=A9SNI1_PHYPA|nr:protein CURVATURE THYLAKOID 1C, chloroplastic-like [Physcomitrium patens]XP_024401346.1 protein CURVATURE THYLAKOID 1C, chloroplastic-like [Physcomitrium patens]PNR36241.1 hypothetical protein PHYPA_022092 [Physcomitrium patens]|eukprot:XP_024401345.1 protein CURVATURE THYLAKOID 1C, chloroplastic-like [Physcomitrella patens]